MDAYEGTRLERQEIYGEILDSVEGALWDMDLIHRWRIGTGDIPPLAHIVIGVDPSGSDAGDECGIVACGKAAERDAKGRAHGYVLEDRSIRNRPSLWGTQVVDLYWHLVDTYPGVRCEVVFETNYGGQMGVDTIKVRDPSVPVRCVTATRGKRVRAEPVALLYDQGRWHHVGVFPEMEEQQCWWTPLEPTSPDRMDALVWAASGLMPELTVAVSGYAENFADQHL
jgi:phage terminase large subunit-like protein